MLRTLLLTLLVVFSVDAAAYSDWVGLRAINVDAPRCDGVIELSASSDYFVEIANTLAGQEEYNELIRFYEAKNWSQFDEKMEIFKTAFETSPLREAAAFLDTEATIAQVETGNEVMFKNAEKKLREVLLLYPKSKFVPVMILSAANMALGNKSHSKAYALFEGGRKDHPFHELNCRFLLGIAESQYLLGEEKSAKQMFLSVLQKCADPFSKLITDIRIADMEISTQRKKSLATYARYAEKFPVRMAKNTPWAVFNIGEIKYQEQQHASAGYFFTEFSKYGKKTDCLAWAMKRTADITVQLGKPVAQGVGAHLSVWDKFPKSEVGKFSRLHAFLIDLEGTPTAEVDRRLKLFDLEIDKISDELFKTTLFFEKGLALLSLKEKSALPYLVNFNERKENYLRDKEIGNYVRNKIFKLLEDETADGSKKVAGNIKAADQKLFEPLEAAYSIWFKGSPQEAKAKNLYRKLILVRMKTLMENESVEEAIARLDRWRKSEIWSEGQVPREADQLVATALLRVLQLADDSQRKKHAASVTENETILKPFLDGDLEAVWLAVWLANGERGKVEGFMKKRSVSSVVPARYPIELRAQLMLIKGKAARSLKRYDEANRFLKAVEYPGLMVEANLERFQIAKDQENPELMLDIVSKLKTHSSTPEYLKLLELAAETVGAKKSWGLANSVYQLAERSNVEKKRLAPFISLKGRADFEAGRYLKAIDSFETAITLSPDLEKEPDLKFRLAKSYLKTKQKERARKQWEELVQLKNETWSPLAENELKLLQSP